jgi:hypothetical protein
MYMKHLISVPALVLSMAACSSDPSTDGTGGTTGSSGSTNNTTAGTSTTGGSLPGTGGSGSGVAGTPATGGTGAGTTGGSSSSTAGTASTAGSTSTGTAGTSTGGTSAGGSSATGGMPSTGGSGPAASFKCDNLTLAPSMTGVAKPAGAAGGLKVLDWAGFKGAASFTFDDNTPSQLDNYAALKATGGHFTWFLIASSAGSGYKATVADGQEIANHSQSHPQPSGANQNEVTQARQTLMTNFGVAAVPSFAAPNCDGAWTPFAKNAAMFNRGPCSKPGNTVSPRDSTDPYALPAYLPASSIASDPSPDTAATMRSAITDGKWRIFVIHGFDTRNGTYKPVPIAEVSGAMSKAVQDGFWVETMGNVGLYWQGQKLIPASATTSATWTVPTNFPANMCVRITTTGGTVKQKGETIGWDPHGYYQISLNAGEVTIE